MLPRQAFSPNGCRPSAPEASQAPPSEAPGASVRSSNESLLFPPARRAGVPGAITMSSNSSPPSLPAKQRPADPSLIAQLEDDLSVERAFLASLLYIPKTSDIQNQIVRHRAEIARLQKQLAEARRSRLTGLSSTRASSRKRQSPPPVSYLARPSDLRRSTRLKGDRHHECFEQCSPQRYGSL